VFGIKARFENRETKEICADLTIDATGRANVLGKLIGKTNVGNSKFKIQNSKLVGFKTHFENVNLEKGVCEIYFFRGGYGGLSFVENDLANHCFLMKAEAVKNLGGDADEILKKTIFENKRAYQTLKDARPVFDWLAVSVDGFGAKKLTLAENLLSVGDAAAFIDPFTGSGMLMAFESAKILAQSIFENKNSFAAIDRKYSEDHHKNFRRRLKICAIMRRAAFAPRLADWIIPILNVNKKTVEFLARATRPQNC
jgi:flavin-dependent dehydrogenase